MKTKKSPKTGIPVPTPPSTLSFEIQKIYQNEPLEIVKNVSASLVLLTFLRAGRLRRRRRGAAREPRFRLVEIIRVNCFQKISGQSARRRMVLFCADYAVCPNGHESIVTFAEGVVTADSPKLRQPFIKRSKWNYFKTCWRGNAIRLITGRLTGDVNGGASLRAGIRKSQASINWRLSAHDKRSLLFQLSRRRLQQTACHASPQHGHSRLRLR